MNCSFNKEFAKCKSPEKPFYQRKTDSWNCFNEDRTTSIHINPNTTHCSKLHRTCEWSCCFLTVSSGKKIYNIQAGWFGNNVVIRNMWPDCYDRNVVGWITGIEGYELFRREAVKEGKECCLTSGNGLIMKRHLWETATDKSQSRVGKG